MSMMSIATKALAAALALTAILAPTQVFAWQTHRGSTAVTATNDPALLNKGPIAPPSFVHPRPLVQPRPFVHRPFHNGTVIYSAPPVYYAPPTYYDPPPTYYAPPASYYPPAAYAPPSGGTVAVAPTPGVINYPHGRYELHGDGVAAPYTWVWIPNPPSSPPPATNPAPPPPAAPPEPSASDGASATPRGPLYRWTDEQGAVHWTDRFDAIPEQYRARAKQVQPS
jgi:hypothetical protein